jgi:PadR family transcriptional regulator
VLDLAVLAVVSERDGYGYDVVRRLRAAGLGGRRGRLGVRDLAPAVQRRASDLLCRAEEGPHRKYYAVNDAGRALLASSTGTWRSFTDAMDSCSAPAGRCSAATWPCRRPPSPRRSWWAATASASRCRGCSTAGSSACWPWTRPGRRRQRRPGSVRPAGGARAGVEGAPRRPLPPRHRHRLRRARLRPARRLQEISNIFAFDADGRPLRDVYLVDQDGNPLVATHLDTPELETRPPPDRPGGSKPGGPGGP